MDPVPGPDPKELQRAESLFAFGGDAATKGNHDYAIDMFRQAARIAPLELKYRQALRASQRRRFGNDPSKVGRLAGAKLQPIRLRVRADKGRSNWLGALEHCEDAFLLNPWDVGISRDFSEAAERLGSRDLARWSMEAVQQQGANDLTFWRHMAHVYEFCEDWKRAILCWERIKKLAPHDEEATHQIHALSASDTISRSGLNERAGGPDDGTGPDASAAEEAEALRGRQAMSPEERFEAALEDDPSLTGPYLELADHYRMQGRLDEARDVLARGVKAKPDDQRLRESYAEFQIARLRKAIESQEAKLRRRPDDPEALAKRDKLRAKLADYELAEYRRRVEQRPEDGQLRFELGTRLAGLGKHDEAIPEFQAARSSPALKVKALIGAGASFEASGVPKLAERSYRDALKAADPEDEATLIDLHYRLGRVAEQMGDPDAAEEHYNEVAAQNFAYLDVAQRLRSLNHRAAP